MGFNIEIFSILWMVIEAVVAIGAGMLAHSLALVVFGVDSVIELVAGFILLWRLGIEMTGASLEKVKRAERLAS
jgi:divalent metal cation (Fe/Co/Zn/Cd) transporter